MTLSGHDLFIKNLIKILITLDNVSVFVNKKLDLSHLHVGLHLVKLFLDFVLSFSSSVNFFNELQEFRETKFLKAVNSDSITFHFRLLADLFHFIPIFIVDCFRGNAFNEWQVLSECVNNSFNFDCNVGCILEVITVELFVKSCANVVALVEFTGHVLVVYSDEVLTSP